MEIMKTNFSFIYICYDKMQIFFEKILYNSSMKVFTILTWNVCNYNQIMMC